MRLWMRLIIVTESYRDIKSLAKARLYAKIIILEIMALIISHVIIRKVKAHSSDEDQVRCNDRFTSGCTTSIFLRFRENFHLATRGA